MSYILKRWWKKKIAYSKFASFVQLSIRISGYPANETGYQKRPDIRYNFIYYFNLDSTFFKVFLLKKNTSIITWHLHFQIKVLYALQTLTGVVRAVYKKCVQLSGFDLVNFLIGKHK